MNNYSYLKSSLQEVQLIIRVICLAPIYIILARILQWIINLTYGPYSKDIKQEKALAYDILWDLKYHFVIQNDINCFQRRYRKVQDISVIEEEGVSLYCINKTHFVFVRARPGTDLYNCDKHPFLFLAQHSSAVELITVSLDAMFRYTNNKPQKDGNNITLSYMNGRCGSTLAASMIHRTGQCVVVSEPWVMLDTLKYAFQGTPKQRAKRDDYIKATILAIAKDPKRRYFIKMGMLTGVLVRVMKDLFPGTREMYMYRGWKPTMSSYRKMLGPFAMTILAGRLVPTCAQEKKHKEIWMRNRVSDPYKKFFFWMFCNMGYFYDEARQRKNIKSFSYESFQMNQEGFIRNLLAHIGIGPEYLKLALSVVSQDSQENSPWSRKKLAGKYGKIPEETYRWTKKVAKEFGIESEGKDYTITNFPNSWETYDGAKN